MARRGRGRLSAIEKLPPEAGEIVVWANRELAKRARDQIDIYQEFYLKLEKLMAESHGELEFAIPSKSAFNRHSIAQAILRQRLDLARAMGGALSQDFDAEASDNLTLIASEALKTLVFEITVQAGEAGMAPKEAKYLADALRSALQAQGVSTLRRQRVAETFERGVTEAVDQVARIRGLTAETAEAIKAQILGVKPEPDRIAKALSKTT